MRILHTSDWHLGRSFHGVGLLEAQREFLEFLAATVEAEHIDVLIVAGDVYDRALPSPEVVDLLDEGLHRLVSTGVKVLLTSGNHDSARRLGFARRLIEASGLSLRTRLGDIDRPLIVEDEHGPVAFYGIPYLEPGLTFEMLGAGARSHTAVLTEATGRIRTDVGRLQAAGGPARIRTVVAAHAFVSGAEASESERNISVGGVESVPKSLFQDFDYVALGHLHGRQALGENVRYSGSPLPYSFSEARQSKGGWIVVLDADGLKEVLPLDAPIHRPLAVLEGELESLLADPAHAWAEEAFVAVTLTDPARPATAMERMRERFPHTVTLRFEPVGAEAGPQRSYASRLASAADDVEICAGFVEHVSGHAPDAEEIRALREALEGVRTAAQAG